MSDNNQIITGFDLWHLSLPVVSARDHGIGRVDGTCEVVILRLTSESGETGWGEASPWVVFTGSPEATFAALDRYIRPLVLGRIVADREKIMLDADRAQDYPEFAVRVDYNQGLIPEDALARVRDVARFRPDFIEQPVRAPHYDLMAQIREAIDVPLLADESVFGPEDMARAIREGICDGVSIKLMKSGGFARAQTVATMAANQGLGVYGGDMFEAGIAHLAGTHLIAATRAIDLGCEFYQARYYLKEDILETPFPCNGGHVQVPDTPGLGIRPDLDKLDHYNIARGRAA